METVGSTRALLKYECLLFDMDDTLYPMSTGLNYACRKNIEEFMSTYLNIEESQVPDMCLDLYREHGTTMAGLKALGYKFDDDAYHAFVHGTLPYLALKPDLVLRNLLLSMPQQKIIFTNADKAHAARVLNRLGLEDCFEGIICFETLNTHPVKEVETQNDGGMNNSSDESATRIICKPALESFQAATVIANLDPNKTIFFDDSVRNIATAKTAGFQTVIVGRSSLVSGADHALSSIHNIREALPELWEDEGEHLEQIFFKQSAVETVVNA
ncbi:putative pyridoxal phosphatase [Helianthus annuus]|nr:putative pyridoxal phosphatase [Helianthus annuus]KAJ0479336.1 putative pyridoxal phosphatase [Helianthus annuus]KAJ0662314.1 putative pyridoxal phosphatase [Helianthus annuus]KAJ0669842.1 putative pyridoxal phosphatase [Helianthus annuus]KAJ0847615.1 putative pyridoxal phosphatase [Helianthus annuus]